MDFDHVYFKFVQLELSKNCLFAKQIDEVDNTDRDQTASKKTSQIAKKK